MNPPTPPGAPVQPPEHTVSNRLRTWVRALVAAGVVAAIILAVTLFIPGRAWQTLPPEPLDAAAPGAPGQVVLLKGVHTVHHSKSSLPSEAARQADGKPTLVWFSGTWCTTCASMDAYAQPTMEQYQPRIALVEKSVDHDRAAVTRYGVRGTPTFVLIDPAGKELARFTAAANAADFARLIEAALTKGGV
ncbi:MAG: hypothetical protein DWI58_01525 [Chloroflexi bacterium]|nr:MAG: hypothetical protein DWI58_01525 [Chloroflexota bacterium]